MAAFADLKALLLEKTLPARQTVLSEIVGTTVPIIVDWNSFADELEALRFVDRHGVFAFEESRRLIF